jgi:hypothetical protein
MVVWIKSLVGLDIPGHRKSGPVVDVMGGKRPGASVVRAWMMRDVVGPKLKLEPQPSAAIAWADGRPNVTTVLRMMTWDALMRACLPEAQSK